MKGIEKDHKEVNKTMENNDRYKVFLETIATIFLRSFLFEEI
jgi:hypothetical protein